MIYLSRDVDYAIRSLAFMAHTVMNNKKTVIAVDDIVNTQRLPRALLRRLLQKLAQVGILQSHKGKGGGFTLRKDPRTITVCDIVNIFMNTKYKDKCLVRRRPCPRIRKCKLRIYIFRINEMVYEKMSSITITSLL